MILVFAQVRHLKIFTITPELTVRSISIAGSPKSRMATPFCLPAFFCNLWPIFKMVITSFAPFRNYARSELIISTENTHRCWLIFLLLRKLLTIINVEFNWNLNRRDLRIMGKWMISLWNNFVQLAITVGWCRCRFWFWSFNWKIFENKTVDLWIELKADQ